MAPTGKAAQNKQKKHDALLNTAFDLFTSKGIADTTISDIASEAGVAKGTFYLYFKDKFDLRDRLVRKKASLVFGAAYDALRETDIDVLEDRVVFLAEHMVRQLEANRLLLRFIAKNLSWSIFTADGPEIEEDEIHYQQLVREEFDRSPVKYRNPEIMLYLIFEMTGGSIYSSILHDQPMPIDDLRPHLLESIRSIMRSQELPSGL